MPTQYMPAPQGEHSPSKLHKSLSARFGEVSCTTTIFLKETAHSVVWRPRSEDDGGPTRASLQPCRKNRRVSVNRRRLISGASVQPREACVKGIVSAHVFDCKRVLFLSSFPQDILSAQLGRVVIDLTAIPVSVRGTGGGERSLGRASFQLRMAKPRRGRPEDTWLKLLSLSSAGRTKP